MRLSPKRLPLFRPDDPRSARERALAVLVQAASLARIPPPAAAFYVRAVLVAWRTGDGVSPAIAARPIELLPILRASAGARRVVEVGTGTAWTAIALTLADRGRRVLSLDVEERPERERYLRLMPERARRRLELALRDGEEGPREERDLDFIFIDSSHRLEETKRTFLLWSARLRPGGVVAFHDWGNPSYPEVSEAIEQLGLEGERSHLLFVWRKPG